MLTSNYERSLTLTKRNLIAVSGWLSLDYFKINIVQHHVFYEHDLYHYLGTIGIPSPLSLSFHQKEMVQVGQGALVSFLN